MSHSLVCFMHTPDTAGAQECRQEASCSLPTWDPAASLAPAPRPLMHWTGPTEMHLPPRTPVQQVFLRSPSSRVQAEELQV